MGRHSGLYVHNKIMIIWCISMFFFFFFFDLLADMDSHIYSLRFLLLTNMNWSEWSLCQRCMTCFFWSISMN